MIIEKLIDNFIVYLTFQKNYSPLTVEAYKRDLDQFKEFLNVNTIRDLSSIDHLVGRRFIVFLEESLGKMNEIFKTKS